MKFAFLPFFLIAATASAQDYSFTRLINYDFASTRDVKRVEEKVDGIVTEVRALATEVKELKTFIHTIPKPAIATVPAPDARVQSLAKAAEAISRRAGPIKPSRVVVVSDGNAEFDSKLDQSFAALKRQDPTWSIGTETANEIQTLRRYGTQDDADEIAALARELKIDEPTLEGMLPLFARIENGEIVRRWMPGCTTPLDAWTFGWLQTGTDRRPAHIEPEKATVARSGHYPLTGGWWSVEGRINPPKEFIVNHLLGGSQHRGQFTRPWLESLSYAEVQSVHTDDHTGHLKTQFVNAPLVTMIAAPVKAAAVVAKTAAVVPIASTRLLVGSSCPNGVCPLRQWGAPVKSFRRKAKIK